jgi:hypothetical protein
LTSTATKQNTVMLSERLRRGLISSTYGTSEQFFVGINAGEWVAACVASIAGAAKSQSLVRIQPANCAEASSTQAATRSMALPRRAAVGLVHFKPRGRLVEVGGDQVRRLYDKPYGESRSPFAARMTSLSAPLPFSTVAFSDWPVKTIRYGLRASMASTPAEPHVSSPSRSSKTSGVSA